MGHARRGDGMDSNDDGNPGKTGSGPGSGIGTLALLGRLANIGLFVAAALLVGLFLGSTADSLLGTPPAGALVGLALGAVAGLREFARICRELPVEPPAATESGEASPFSSPEPVAPPARVPDRTDDTESADRPADI